MQGIHKKRVISKVTVFICFLFIRLKSVRRFSACKITHSKRKWLFPVIKILLFPVKGRFLSVIKSILSVIKKGKEWG
ncbi:hypothetical protein BACCELL_01978 [Bacteroides cellulosilyticus DSM 14838]|uniref:Uncharacterized protein n=1 Tax=Bacteroides cellulosilyticus DSM 14838 TaxID=537012 RepID=E2NCG9_9BACE|nr:hypothetical protein BACCELL_01978 [Bacteroides cellulosilyticus DSM 14838]